MLPDTRLTPVQPFLAAKSNVFGAHFMSVKSNDAAGVRKSQRTAAEAFPLFRRADGRWCKKIRGKHRYFGYDKDKALEKYQREIGLLSQGLEPETGDIGLREMFNAYLTAKQREMAAGSIGARSLSDSASTLRRVLEVVNDRLVSTLVSDDFVAIKAKLGRGRNIITVAGDIRRTKAAFNWALRQGVITKLPLFGDEFRPAPMRAVRLAKAQRAALIFDAGELRKLLAKASVQLRAMILLGANAALLPIDIARLELGDFSDGFTWLRQPRGKTGVDRAAALWPETTEALKKAISERSKPAKPEYAALVFLTEYGNPVVRTRKPAKAATDKKAELAATVINRVTSDFRDLQKSCKVYRHGRGFNALRHGFLTIAESGKDFPAVAKVMGHSLPGVSTHYREHIGEDRIKACCEVVRAWLYPANSNGGKRKPK